MGYLKADTVLPDEIIKIIQSYVDGEYIYIPRKEDNKKSWGEKKGTRKELKIRNKEIFKKYISGKSISDLSREYYLSEKSISRIIRKEKEICA